MDGDVAPPPLEAEERGVGEDERLNDVDIVGVTVGVGEIVTEDVCDKLEPNEGVLDGVSDVDGDCGGTTDVDLVSVAVDVG